MKIPKDPSGIIPLLARTSVSELLLIITDKNILKITGMLSSKIKYHKYSFKFNMTNSIPTNTNKQINKHHNPETWKVEYYLIIICEQEWKASTES